MTWRLAVTHRTGYRYASPVRASYNEARMTPLSTGGQATLTSRLEVTPAVRPLRYRDYWGTIVDAFDVHVPHEELTVVASAIVETGPVPSPPADVPWSALADAADRFAEFLLPSRYVVEEPELLEVGQELRASAPAPLAAGLDAVGWAHQAIAYRKGVTGVATTSAEARALGGGVCQDYPHLTLAVLRGMGVPARYVSGYLHPGGDPGRTTVGESHAWLELWAGDWVPADPTTLAPVGPRHVLVARGRDYADVRPLAGVYSGPPASALGVEVELTRLR